MGNSSTSLSSLSIESQAIQILEEEVNDNDHTLITLPTSLNKEDHLTTKKEDQCLICQKNASIYLTLPCHHRWICNHCLMNYEKYLFTTCQKCHQSIKEFC